MPVEIVIDSEQVIGIESALCAGFFGSSVEVINLLSVCNILHEFSLIYSYDSTSL